MMNDNSKVTRLAKNSIFMTLRMIFVMLISFYTVRVTLQVLGIVDYGIYNVICGFVSMFGFLQTAFSNGVQRFYNYELGKSGLAGAKGVFNTSIQIQVLVAIILAIIIEGIGVWYMNKEMVLPIERLQIATVIFHFSVLSFLFVIFQVPFTAAVMAHEKMNFYAIIGILDAVLKLLVVLIAKVTKYDNLLTYGILYSFIPLFDLILYVIYCRINFSEARFEFVFNKKLFISMVRFSGWNTFGSFSNVMRDQGVNLILNTFFGPTVNAARGIAMQINTGVSCFVQSILVPARPQIIQSYATGNICRSISITYSISKLCVFTIILMAIPVCYEMPYLLDIWLDSNVPDMTTIFSILIILTSVVLLLISATSVLVHASGIMRDYQVWGSLIKLLSVPLAYFCFKYGASSEWAFLLVLLFDILGFLYGLKVLNKTIGLDIGEYFEKVIFKMIPTISIGLMTPIPIFFLFEPSLLRVTLVCILSVFSTSLIFYLTGLSSTERGLVYEYIMKAIRKWK